MPDFRSRLFWISIVLIILAGVIGFFAGQRYNMSKAAKAPKDASNSLFVNQEANIRGKITNKTDDSLTVQSDSGQTGTVKLAEEVIINRFDDRARPATPSSDLRSIELNRDASINLKYVDGEYVVYNITFLPQIPPRRNVPPSRAVSTPTPR